MTLATRLRATSKDSLSCRSQGAAEMSLRLLWLLFNRGFV